jgi:hypothetical protein
VMPVCLRMSRVSFASRETLESVIISIVPISDRAHKERKTDNPLSVMGVLDLSVSVWREDSCSSASSVHSD